MNTDTTITAILLCYWEERLGYVTEIIDALLKNTVPPSNILVFNNNPDLKGISFEHATTLNSGENFYCSARHVASLLYNTRFYYFQDDDLVVENPKLLQTLSEVLVKNPESIVSIQGRNIIQTSNGDVDFDRLEDRETDEEVLETDIAFGRLHMCGKGPILRMLNVRHQHNIYSNRGDDIALSLSNRMFGYKNYIVKTVGRERNLDVSTGLYRLDGHLERRKAVAMRFLDIMNANKSLGTGETTGQ